MTAAHILKLAKLGGYNSNHFFRVDKGFVAQTASIAGGRLAPLDRKQQVLHHNHYAALLTQCTCLYDQQNVQSHLSAVSLQYALLCVDAPA